MHWLTRHFAHAPMPTICTRPKHSYSSATLISWISNTCWQQHFVITSTSWCTISQVLRALGIMCLRSGSYISSWAPNWRPCIASPSSACSRQQKSQCALHTLDAFPHYTTCCTTCVCWISVWARWDQP